MTDLARNRREKIFANAHGRTKYQLFRTVRPFAHPLATKARRRQRQNPLRNCALFRMFGAVSTRSAPERTADRAQSRSDPATNAYFRVRPARKRTADRTCDLEAAQVFACSATLE